MPKIIKKAQMLPILEKIDVISAMEEGFIAYSNGKAVVPPVGELIVEEHRGEVHIKYGYIKSDAVYVIKIASGFYNNPQIGLPSGQGMMLVFNQKTGEPVAILLDEGYLTAIRTAAAGALAAKYFAPKKVNAIGIIGTGEQAKLQLEFLQKVRPCKKVWVWGRNPDKAEQFKANLYKDFDIQIAQTPAVVAANSNLIVTTTPSTTALLDAKDIQLGTHITAMGSDTMHKQELDAAILQKADLVISDSLPQSKSRGEIYQACKAGLLSESKVIELGTAIQDPKLQRSNDQQISIVDLTGVAVQDIKIAKAVYLNS